MRWTVVVPLAASLAVLAGCASGPADDRTVSGTFIRVGGPAPGAPFPLPGTITARTAAGAMFTATAGSNGRFKLSLPPGAYHVTGRSPLIQSGQAVCDATKELRVSRSTPEPHITVVCSIS
jgi:hypothetical protein